jgi:hypothetical protein
MDVSDESAWARRLAKALLARHLQVSFPPLAAVPDWFSPDGAWLPPDNQYALDLKARRRAVAVIGAGASWPVLPLGQELAAEFEREIGVQHEADYVDELTRLRRVYGLPGDFETRLVALCRRPEDERKVRDKIAEIFGISQPSVIAYELIAHLLKHRYLDAVISFNFDELLDQSLADELGKGEYVRVLSERDCRLTETDPDHPDYVPLYIKMHGTASEPESLRFTRESYYWTPRAIIKVVQDLLNTENLVVMNVGCRLASFDFQYLLQEPRKVSLFQLNPAPLDSQVLNAIQEFRGEDKAPIETIACDETATPSKDFLAQTFGRLMAALEHEVRTGTVGLAHWRPVGRHLAAPEILDTDRVSEHTAEYLRQRTVLEVAFAAAKGRGVASTASLVDERCGRYYDLYASAVKDEGGTPATWATICAAGGLVESDDASDVYYADQAVCGEGEPPTPCRTRPATTHTLRAIDPQRLASRVLSEIDSSKWSAPDAPSDELAAQAERLASIMSELCSEGELDIHSLDDRVCSKVFVEPLLLPTHTAFHAWARKLLVGDDYDEIRIVAETGGWLTEDGVRDWVDRLGDGKIKVIVAFDLHKSAFKERLGARVDLQRIPWWRHNRHMRLLCKNGQPVRGLYYARLLRTSMVTPVFLRHGADLKRLELGWERLWQEAKDHGARLKTYESADEVDEKIPGAASIVRTSAGHAYR